MRIQSQLNETSNQFAEQLMLIGEGKIKTNNDTQEITLPQNFGNIVTSTNELIEKTFPNLNKNYKDMEWLSQRAILAPKYDVVNQLNDTIQSKLPGEIITYTSIDTAIETNQAVNYPVEFLNNLEISGMPSHKLSLKEGSIIIVLRNLDPPKLCNGSRLIITNLKTNLIEAKILKGKFKDEIVFIPRIPMVSVDLTFEFKRLQFPVKLAFAITINKAQGQSLQYAGIHLEEECFSHGQLYVAFSRVGSSKNLYIYAPNNKIKNIVYPIVLN